MQDYHLLLLDDGSTDGTGQEVAKAMGSRVTVLRGNGKWWWGGSLQQAYKWLIRTKVADEDRILIMNNDIEFDHLFLATGMRLSSENPSGLLAAVAYLASGQIRDVGIKIDWNKFEFNVDWSGKEIDCLSTRGLILSMRSFKKIGGFYPVILPHYFSDYEFTHRAFRKGFRLYTDRSFRVAADETTTGEVTIPMDNKRKAVVAFFSKRYKANPIYRISFILLAGPGFFVKAKLVSKELYRILLFFYGILFVSSKRHMGKTT